jgi:phosphoserine phosphatase
MHKPRPTVVWDFDGTLLPSVPYDSEQYLLHYLLRRSGSKIPLIGRVFGNLALFTDRKQWIPAFFKRVFVWLLTGTPISVIERVAGELAQRIPQEDKSVLVELKKQGFPMMVLSCGTVDLSRKVLQEAGIGDCFQHFEGNRFRIFENRIVGTEVRVPDPEHKIKLLMDEYGLEAQEVIAVGDGYTDIPLLDWAGISVLIKRGATKAVGSTKYYTISSVAEIANILNLSGWGSQ